MRSLVFLFVLLVIHTLPLWNTSENLAGTHGDPLAHAAIPKWYCSKVVLGDLHANNFLAPTGFDLHTNYDSPFPFIATCAFDFLGSHGQFHLFVFFQIALILFSAWLVSRLLFKEALWQITYCLFIWWCGYYVARSSQHFTLLSNIWGLQFLIWVFLSIQWGHLKGVFGRGLILGLVFSGTFQNMPILFVPLLGLLAYAFFKKEAPAVNWLKKMQGLGILVFSSLLIFLPLYAPAIYAVINHDYQKWPFTRTTMNLDLLSPLLPWKENLFYNWLEQKPAMDLESFNPFDLLVLLFFFISLFFWKFWKSSLRLTLLAIALFSFWFSLGSEVRFNGDLLFSNPLFDRLSEFLPFSLSRTPSRSAVVTNLILIFLGFEFLREKIVSPKKLPILVGILLTWILVTGPIMNQNIFVTTYKYAEMLPMKGLESLKKSPEDNIVLNLPLALAGDPSQNFMWLIHGHNINAGYLAYTAYTNKSLEPIEADPLLGKLACEGERLGFQKTPVLENPLWVQGKLRELKAHGLIFNKMFLRMPKCQSLWLWVQELRKQNWVSVSDENNFYLVLEFK